MAVREESIYADVPGGRELVRWFGKVPYFHDGEIVGLHLNRGATSFLNVRGWNMTDRVDANGYFVLECHVVVTFALDGIMDLCLEHFSAQNVINGLTLRRAPDRPERLEYLTLVPKPEDIEIELEPCSGLNGFIRARSVVISFDPEGRP